MKKMSDLFNIFIDVNKQNYHFLKKPFHLILSPRKNF